MSAKSFPFSLWLGPAVLAPCAIKRVNHRASLSLSTSVRFIKSKLPTNGFCSTPAAVRSTAVVLEAINYCSTPHCSCRLLQGDCLLDFDCTRTQLHCKQPQPCCVQTVHHRLLNVMKAVLPNKSAHKQVHNLKLWGLLSTSTHTKYSF